MMYTNRLDIKVRPKTINGDGVLFDAGIEGVTLSVSDSDGLEKYFIHLPNDYLEFLYEWLVGLYLDDIETAQDATYTRTS